MTLKTRIALTAILISISLGIGAASLAAQAKQGPLPPPAEGKVIKIPAGPGKVEAPPVPPEEIIRAFTQKEEVFLQARAGYSFQKTVRIVEYGEDGKSVGEFQYTTEGKINSDGNYYERIVKRPDGELPDLVLQPEDLEILWRAPLFPFIPTQAAKYVLTYSGKQQVDELNTYVFQVKPRQVDRAHAYLDGLVWVDDRDLSIVKVYGKWITETGAVSTPEVPFTFFETYRENVDGKYWFPAYVRSDAMLKLRNREVPLRLTIRWTDYKPFTAPPAKNP
jgi:hypothetical protein